MLIVLTEGLPFVFSLFCLLLQDHGALTPEGCPAGPGP
jgi:hypothetical protein